jgi:hypothetical protein
MGLFDKFFDGIGGWIMGMLGKYVSPNKPTVPGQSFDEWKAQLPDGTFFLVHKLIADGVTEGIEATEGTKGAKVGYWSHVASIKIGDAIIEAISEGLVWQNIDKYNDPKMYQLVAFVLPLTTDEVFNLKVWLASRVGTPYPIQEIAHDALPLIPGVKYEWDCSGATATSHKYCAPRFRIFPVEKDNCPEGVTPQEIYDECEPQAEVCKMIPWNVVL